MSYNFFYKKLEQNAKNLFPALNEIPPHNWDHLVSPLELRLPKTVLEKAQAAVTALFTASRRPGYASQLESVPGISDVNPGNRSVLMAYDFHTTESGECFLVEVNTNASGYLVSCVMEMTHTDGKVADSIPLIRLAESFLEELKLSGQNTTRPRIAISDDDIEQQKMYIEFLMYRDWFRGLGWRADFCEGGDFTERDGRLATPEGEPVDLVYNRLTDFYLESPQHVPLRKAFHHKRACLSPNPREYWLLADKQRLIQLTTPGFLEAAGATEDEMAAIRGVLIPTFEKSAFASTSEIWAQRRSLFFKPKRSFGGKSVYRGESVSRKVFERLMSEDILIQRFFPAQKMPTEDPRSVLSNWKFELRCYAYGDQIQMVAARIYQGQVTNFSSPLGGYTFVQFV